MNHAAETCHMAYCNKIRLLVTGIPLVLLLSCGNSEPAGLTNPNDRGIKKSANEQQVAFEPKYVQLTANLVMGRVDDTSVLIVNLFNPVARQEQNWNFMQKKALANKAQLREVPYITVDIPADTWQEHLKLYFRSYAKSRQPQLIKADQATLVLAPTVDQTELRATNQITLRYKLDGSLYRKIAMSRVFVEFHYKGQTILSNNFHYQLPRQSDQAFISSFSQQVAVAGLVGDFEQMKTLSNELISFKPEASSGYLYLGIASEAQGDYGKALEAYQQAVKRLPLPGQSGSGEQQGYVDIDQTAISRLNNLRRRLQ